MPILVHLGPGRYSGGHVVKCFLENDMNAVTKRPVPCFLHDRYLSPNTLFLPEKSEKPELIVSKVEETVPNETEK
jgi:hypothetical protein